MDAITRPLRSAGRRRSCCTRGRRRRPPPAEVGGDEESPVDAAVGTEEEALLQLLFACAAFPHHAQVRQTAATGDCRGEHSLRGPEQSPKEPEQFPRD